MVDLTPIETR